VSHASALGEFRKLANAAGRCLADLPTELKGVIRGVAEDPRIEELHSDHEMQGDLLAPELILAEYWLIILHRLGWQAHRWRTGTLPAVRPSLIERIGEEFVPSTFDIERREDLMWSRIDNNSIFDPNEREKGDLFLSCLPFDVFESSVYAIDTILQMDRDDLTTRPRDAGQLAVAEGGMTKTEPANEDDSSGRETPVGTIGGGKPSEAK
jgi:hypothetical protein